MVIERLWLQLSNKWCIKWRCSNCNHDKLENIGYHIRKPIFDASKQIKCPNCNSYGKKDALNLKRVEIDTLNDRMNNDKLRVELLIEEVNEMEKEWIV